MHVALYATPISSIQETKLVQKGKRIAKVMCDVSKLPLASSSIKKSMQRIQASHACSGLNKAKRKAVAYFLHHKKGHSTFGKLHVPQNAKCPVCGMFVAKYPKWAASLEVEQKTYYFDGVKDMMKYIIFDGDFPYDRKKIALYKVSDYYTIESLNAKEAFYVIGSNVYGPMGNELIPFKTLKSAEVFMQEHHGEKIVMYSEITDKMLMALDGFTE